MLTRRLFTRAALAAPIVLVAGAPAVAHASEAPAPLTAGPVTVTVRIKGKLQCVATLDPREENQRIGASASSMIRTPLDDHRFDIYAHKGLLYAAVIDPSCILIRKELLFDGSEFVFGDTTISISAPAAHPAEDPEFSEHYCMGCCRRDTNPDAIIAAFNKMSPEERQRRTAGIRSALAMVGPR